MFTKSALFSTLRNRNFALLWVGQLVSLAGDYTFGVAVAFLSWSGILYILSGVVALVLLKDARIG